MAQQESFLGVIWETIAAFFVPIHREGHQFVILGTIISLILLWLWSDLGWLCVFVTLFIAFFFRDPERIVPLREGLVLSPADGKIRAIEKGIPPSELELGDEIRTCISISLSIFDVHINRTPVAGQIIRSVYTPGLFLNSDLDKASKDNERWSWVLQTRNDQQIGVVQIAGIIGRRIVSFVSPQQKIGAGERFGMIRFGSRVDIYVPPNHNPLCAVGQRVVAGETVLADLDSEEPEREARMK
ncbi:MAG: phosphatidylserine decarboxylase [Pseudomonadota bacterium]